MGYNNTILLPKAKQLRNAARSPNKCPKYFAQQKARIQNYSEGGVDKGDAYKPSVID